LRISPSEDLLVPVPLHVAVRAAQKAFELILDDLAAHEKPPQFVKIPDCMVYLHTEWQSLIAALKSKADCEEIAVQAARLAGAALKFSADFGDYALISRVLAQPRRR
jgi:hypothetical protein